MKQKLVNDEFKSFLEGFKFQGAKAEQMALIYALLKITKKFVNTMSKKATKLVTVKSKVINS